MRAAHRSDALKGPWWIAAALAAAVAAALAGCAKPAEPETPAEPAADLSFLEKMPSALKHDGFAYSGLGNPRPTKYRLTTSDGAAPKEGEQTSKFVEMRDGTAVFEVVRSGGLADLGTDELAVAQDGIYALKTSLGELDSRSMEMPAAPTTNKRWSNKSKLTTNDGQAVTIEGDYRVVGMEKITVPAGEFEALVVTAEGPIQVGDRRMTMQARSWYVKDVGVVKQTIERRQGSDAPVIVTLEMLP